MTDKHSTDSDTVDRATNSDAPSYPTDSAGPSEPNDLPPNQEPAEGSRDSADEPSNTNESR